MAACICLSKDHVILYGPPPFLTDGDVVYLITSSSKWGNQCDTMCDVMILHITSPFFRQMHANRCPLSFFSLFPVPCRIHVL